MLQLATPGIISRLLATAALAFGVFTIGAAPLSTGATARPSLLQDGALMVEKAMTGYYSPVQMGRLCVQEGSRPQLRDACRQVLMTGHEAMEVLGAWFTQPSNLQAEEGSLSPGFEWSNLKR